MSPLASMPMHAGSSAGAPVAARRRASSSTLWSRRSMPAARSPAVGSCITATVAASISRSSTLNALPKPASSPRSAASATATTMRSPKPLTGCSRPRSSIDEAPGETWTPWSSPPSHGSTGSTTAVSSNRSATSRRPRRKPPTTLSLRQPRWPRRTQTNLPPANPGRFTAIFVANDEQKALAEASKRKLEERFGRSIATDILPASPFYRAEEYHQNYYKKNPLRYRFYRFICGRDAGLKQVWGDEAGGGEK